MSRSVYVWIAALLVCPVVGANPGHRYPRGFLVSKRAWVLRVQYKDMPPTTYDVPLDYAGWGDVCALKEKLAVQTPQVNQYSPDGVSFTIRASGPNSYEVTFTASKVITSSQSTNAPIVPQPQLPSPEGVRSRTQWGGTLTMAPGQTIAMPLNDPKWHASITRIAQPAPVVEGTEVDDPCW